jgi:4-amino-4-deoxy-L-arabinose transferase-like glycosyltransferase
MANRDNIIKSDIQFLKAGRINPTLILSIILILGLAMRLFLLSMRWINPDEGAHLLDARLLLEGQLPVADFGSRQPFYVLIIALFLKLFGVSTWAGRLVPLFSSLGVGWLLYLFGKRWRDSNVGLIAASFYIFLPLVLVWSTIVKTEQLAIFLGLTSMYFLITANQDKAWPLVLSGLFAALAFYVRQPTLYLPLATIVFLAWRRNNSLKNIISYIGGYLGICLAVIAIYLPKMSFQDMLFSQLNPLNLIWNRLMHMIGLLPAQYRIVDEAGFRVLNQSLDYTLTSWHHALSACLFLLVGAVFMLRKEKEGESKFNEIKVLLFLWIGFSFILYIYQTASRGFYSQYFTEDLPPLILLASVYIKEMIAESQRKWSGLAIVAFLLFFGIFLFQQFFPQIRPGMAGYFVLSLGFATVFYFFLFNSSEFSKISVLGLVLLLALAGATTIVYKMMGLHDFYRFLLVLALLAAVLHGLESMPSWRIDNWRLLLLLAFFYTALQSGLILSPRYEGIWTQKTLTQVIGFLEENSEKSDDVLSGGMIWTFESGLKPYLNVPHPTQFLKHRYAGFEEMVRKNPPQFIILDGYTHRKFAKHWTYLKEFMEINYTREARFEGSKYPVDIFQIMPQVRGESGFITEGKVTP